MKIGICHLLTPFLPHFSGSPTVVLKYFLANSSILLPSKGGAHLSFPDLWTGLPDSLLMVTVWLLRLDAKGTVASLLFFFSNHSFWGQQPTVRDSGSP